MVRSNFPIAFEWFMKLNFVILQQNFLFVHPNSTLNQYFKMLSVAVQYFERIVVPGSRKFR